MNPLLKSAGNRPRSGKVKKCRYCHTEFYVSPSHYTQPYCNFNCHKAWLKVNSTKTELVCAKCSKTYTTHRSQIKHRGSNYCSKKCQAQLSNRFSKTAANKRVRSGQMRSLDNVFSRIIRARDGRCLHCGATESLQCSHVLPRTYFSVRWEEDNAITLCYRCHLQWWHKYPHEAVEWFDSEFPGRHGELIEMVKQYHKIDREAMLRSLKERLKQLQK